MSNVRVVLLICWLIICGNTVYGMEISGIVLNAQSHKPVEFANIGIRGISIGTVSGTDGRFRLLADSAKENDTVMFSMIGYNAFAIILSALSTAAENEILLTEKIYDLTEVVVRPKIFKERTLVA